MLIGFALLHDKSAAINENQCQAILSRVTLNTDQQTGEHWYTINGLQVSHQAIFFQVIPQGVTRPPSSAALQICQSRCSSSHVVLYGSDQPSNNRRFFNWAIKRGVDHNCEVLVIIKDHTQMTMSDLKSAAQELSETKLFIDRNWGYLLGPKLLRVIGQLTESMTFAQAISELKDRIIAAGYTHG